MFSKIKLGLYALIVIYFVFNLVYIKSLKDDLKVSETNNAELLKVQAENTKTIEELKNDYSIIKGINQRYLDTITKQTDRLDALNSKLSKLEKVAKAKPQLTEKLINKGSDKVIRCFEGITNNDLTDCD